MFKKLSPQTRMALALLAVVLVFTTLWFFIYLPKEKKLRNLGWQLADNKSQIQQIEQIIAIKSQSENKRGSREEFRFAEQEKESWVMLSDLASQFDLKVGSIRSNPKEFFLDENSQKVMIEGKACQKIRVILDMKGRYESLIGYLEKLKESLPTYMTIEKMQLHKADSETNNLSISLELYLYLLS